MSLIKSLLERKVAFLSSLIATCLFFVTSWQLFHIIYSESQISYSFVWANLGTHEVVFDYQVFPIQAFFQFLVALIALAVNLYSIAYIQNKRSLYFGFLNLFVFAMQMLIAQQNLIVFFVFWEVMSLASFFLINFDNSSVSAKAATKAFLINRLGDVGLLVAIGLLISNGVDTFSLLALSFPTISADTQLMIASGIALSAFIKSGQFPFSSWLVRAMEAPTPISALLHAATLVAAGIYLLIQTQTVFNEVEIVAQIIAWLALFSMVASSLAAYFTKPLKKHLAASTISQLGFMAIAVGMGIWQAALLHLFTHAFFKASLFLGAGVVIHQNDEKDMYQLSGKNFRQLPLLFGIYLIALAALAGLPLTSGFLSKEWILQFALHNQAFFGFLLLGTSLLTALYIGRQIKLVFFGNNPIRLLQKLPQPRLWYLGLWLLFLGSWWFSFSISPLEATKNYWTKHLEVFSAEAPLSFSVWLPVSTVLLSLLGIALGFSDWIYCLLIRSKALSALGENYFEYLDGFFYKVLWKPTTTLAHSFAEQKPVISATKFAAFWVSIGNQVAFTDQTFDKIIDNASKVVVVWGALMSWIDRFLVDGLIYIFIQIADLSGKILRGLQNGKVQFYILVMLIVLVIVLWMIN